MTRVIVIQDQKLLSFTDNRQDAALQAGHFNDFVQVVRLRAGIRKALELAGQSLTYANIGEADRLGLSTCRFWTSPTRTRSPALAPVPCAITSNASRNTWSTGPLPIFAAAGASCCPTLSSARC
jgi:hypothetical protein